MKKKKNFSPKKGKFREKNPIQKLTKKRYNQQGHRKKPQNKLHAMSLPLKKPDIQTKQLAFFSADITKKIYKKHKK